MDSFYQTEFDRFLAEEVSGANDPERQRHLNLFLSEGFPNTKQEDWRYTSVAQLQKTPFQFTDYHAGLDEKVKTILQTIPPGFQNRIIIINGVYQEQYSTIPDGLSVDTTTKSDLSVRKESWLTHWNSAFIRDTITVHVEKDSVINDPVYMAWISIFDDESQVMHSRVDFVVNESSDVTVYTENISEAGTRNIVNQITGFHCGNNSRCDHVHLERHSDGIHFHTMEVTQDTHSHFSSIQLSEGSEINRKEVRIHLDGAGCDTQLRVLGLLNGKNHVDYQTDIHHHNVHGTSHEVVKNILKNKSHAVFNGRVIVGEGAQKTDATQTNKNILLSEDARVNANPQLEIYADDVACSHGSTTGELDDDALFYIQSRGISFEAARDLMISGFSAEIIDSIGHDSIRTHFNNHLENWLGA